MAWQAGRRDMWTQLDAQPFHFHQSNIIVETHVLVEFLVQVYLINVQLLFCSF
jgi:hypothetical protein